MISKKVSCSWLKKDTQCPSWYLNQVGIHNLPNDLVCGTKKIEVARTAQWCILTKICLVYNFFLSHMRLSSWVDKVQKIFDPILSLHRNTASLLTGQELLPSKNWSCFTIKSRGLIFLRILSVIKWDKSVLSPGRIFSKLTFGQRSKRLLRKF